MTTPAHQSLVAAYAARPGEPAWLADARKAALGRLEALGLPTQKLEDWRFTSLSALTAERFARPAPVEGAVAALPAADGPRLVFVNGRLRPDLSSTAGLPAGALATTLADALKQAPEKVKPHLGRLALADGHAFVAANTALFDDGAFVYLPPGVKSGAIALVHVTAPEAAPVASFPRTLVVAGAGAEAAVEELFLGAGAAAYLTGAVTELMLGEGAKVEHLRLQVEAPGAFHVGVVAAEQAAGASLSAHAFSLGGRLSRSELRTRLAGEGAAVAANGLYMADGAQLVDNFSWVEHAVPRCTTAETYKGILDGKARGVFSGRIVVQPNAQKTQAYQMNSNLLLSDDAVVDTKPQLEIFADDVKCGHGGTVGQLDEAALFYLRSRGLGEAEAQALLVWAFASEMVGKISDARLRHSATRLVAARLPAGSALLEAA
ncbi:MAG: Fe-S cluster assembly protein SufD [Anaeromyxobacteraceae bacterium]